MNADRPSCQQRIRERGQERACARIVGVVTWTDYAGIASHTACQTHLASMKRRWPETVAA